MEIMNQFTKGASGVSFFNSRQMLIVNDMVFSDVSAFYANKKSEEGTYWYDKLSGFYQMVVSRKEYLDGLPSLGENWISGNSSPPSREVIENSKKLLDTFNSYLVRKKQQGMQIDVPKLVIGPIPSGGVGVEFHANNEKAIYISIFNNNTVEIEIKKFDFYSTIEPTDLNRGMIAGYEMLANTNGNSG